MLNYIFLDKTAIESITYNVPRVCQTLGTFIGHDAWAASLGELLLNVKIEYIALSWRKKFTSNCGSDLTMAELGTAHQV